MTIFHICYHMYNKYKHFQIKCDHHIAVNDKKQTTARRSNYLYIHNIRQMFTMPINILTPIESLLIYRHISNFCLNLEMKTGIVLSNLKLKRKYCSFVPPKIKMIVLYVCNCTGKYYFNELPLLGSLLGY